MDYTKDIARHALALFAAHNGLVRDAAKTIRLWNLLVEEDQCAWMVLAYSMKTALTWNIVSELPQFMLSEGFLGEPMKRRPKLVIKFKLQKTTKPKSSRK